MGGPLRSESYFKSYITQDEEKQRENEESIKGRSKSYLTTNPKEQRKPKAYKQYYLQKGGEDKYEHLNVHTHELLIKGVVSSYRFLSTEGKDDMESTYMYV